MVGYRDYRGIRTVCLRTRASRRFGTPPDPTCLSLKHICIGFAHLSLLHLAHCIAWQGIDNREMTGALEACKFGLSRGKDGIQTNTAFRLRHQDRDHAFPKIGMRGPDDSAFLNP